MFTEISGSFKQLRATELHPFTVIVGPHFSGKSSILQAIYLAWHQADWFSAYRSAGDMSTRLAGSNGLLSVQLQTKIGSARYAVYNDAAQVSRDAAIEELARLGQLSACLPRIGGPLSGQKVLTELVAQFGPQPAETGSSWFDTLGGAEHATAASVRQHLAMEYSDPARVEFTAAAAVEFAARKNALGRDIGKLMRKIDELRPKAIRAPAAELARLRAAIEQSVAAQQAASVARAGAPMPVAAEVDVQPETESKIERVLRKWGAAVLQLLSAANPGLCPVCSQEVDSEALHNSWQHAVRTADARRAEQVRLPVRQVVASPPPAPVADASVHLAHRTKLYAELAELQRGEAAWEELDRLQLEVAESRAEQGRCKTLELLCRNELARQSRRAAETATERANAFLVGAPVQVQVEVGEGWARWCAVVNGVARDFGSMSGAEEATVRLAKMLAESARAPFSVVLLDDAELGAITAECKRDLISALRAAQHAGLITQVIVATTDARVLAPRDFVIRTPQE